MKRVLHVARTEVLEHRRQPAMLAILALNYVLWGGAFIVFLSLLGTVSQDANSLALLESQAKAFGICEGEAVVGAMLRLATSTFGAVMFTNLPLFVAIMSGYSVLHDRANNALPFLMLAPLSRYQLLLGKVLGASFFPFLLHLVGVGLVSVVASTSPMLTDTSQFGGSAAWWVSFAIGAPASGLLVGSIGTVISALSRDVRTSMQFTSFFIGLLSLGIGFALFDGISAGAAAQLMIAGGMTATAIAVLGVGSRIVSRELRA